MRDYGLFNGIQDRAHRKLDKIAHKLVPIYLLTRSLDTPTYIVSWRGEH